MKFKVRAIPSLNVGPKSLLSIEATHTNWQENDTANCYVEWNDNPEIMAELLTGALTSLFHHLKR